MAKVGRPLKYKTVEKLDSAIDEYFEESLKTKDKDNGDRIFIDPPTITGLAYHLGFASRQSMYDYEEREEFSYSIKRACLRIEIAHEQNLFSTGATGSIFWLKNRGWKDKVETDLNVNQLPSLLVEVVKPNESK
jgi:hypothetical protein